MNLTEQQSLLIIARHEWPDSINIQQDADYYEPIIITNVDDYVSTIYLDHNFIEPIWNQWLDRLVTRFTEQSEDLIKQDKIDPNDIRNWARANALNDLLKLSTPLDKANALIKYWLAAGEITEEDLK